MLSNNRSSCTEQFINSLKQAISFGKETSNVKILLSLPFKLNEKLAKNDENIEVIRVIEISSLKVRNKREFYNYQLRKRDLLHATCNTSLDEEAL